MFEKTTTLVSPSRWGRRTQIAGAAAGTVVVGAAAAFAYWTAGGSGTGTAGTNSVTEALTVVQTATPANIRPGAAAQTLSGNFTNGNDEPIYVGTVTASIASVTKATGAPTGTCDATDYVLSAATMNVGAQVPVGTAQGSWSGATIEFNNKASVNQDACKGATVNFNYAIGSTPPA